MPAAGPPPGSSSAAEAGAAGGGARKPIFLIGMPGAGKTTIGKMLAAALRYEFIDCDAELERRTGARIATMFELEGEQGFREREALLLEELTARPATVLATGGGAVLREDNRACLRSRGLVILLEVSAAEIARRTAHDSARPLLQGGDRRERIESLLAARAPLYRRTAHLRFRSPIRNPRRLAAAILAHPRLAALRPPDTPPGPPGEHRPGT